MKKVSCMIAVSLPLLAIIVKQYADNLDGRFSTMVVELCVISSDKIDHRSGSSQSWLVIFIILHDVLPIV